MRALRYNPIILAYCYNWFSILELLGDLLQKRPKDTDSIDNVIIVDNIPVVGEDRLPKLNAFVSVLPLVDVLGIFYAQKLHQDLQKWQCRRPQTYSNSSIVRVKSGSFGQSSKFGQQPCFFYV